MFLTNYLGLLRATELDLADGFRRVADGHSADSDVYFLCRALAGQCDDHADKLGPFAERYGEVRPDQTDRVGTRIFEGTRGGGFGLLRDLHDLYAIASFCYVGWTMINQAAQGTRDAELLEVVDGCQGEVATQVKWLETRMKQAAPQVLIVAS